MSPTGIGATGKLPFLREIFRLEPLALSGRDAQLLPHMLESLASVEICSRGSTQLAAAKSQRRSTPLATRQVERWRQSWPGCNHPRYRCRIRHCVH